MSIESIKHNIIWNSWIGDVARKSTMIIGLKLLSKGRKLLKWSHGRCSWCGANCGFSSTVSRKGLRCCSSNRDCTEMPDV